MFALALVTACATADGGGGGGDDDDDDQVGVDASVGGTPDAATLPQPDASTGGTPDASTGTAVDITLSQSNAMTISDVNSVACLASDPLTEALLYHEQNSYYRAFTLTTHGVTSAFTVNKVTVGISSAAALSGGTQPASVLLHTVAGSFPSGALTLVGNQSFSVPDTATSTLIDVPIAASVPAGSTLVVEVSVPSGEVTADAPGNLLFVGANGAGETGPSYLAAAGCGVATPTASSELGLTDPMHVVLTVTGTHVP